MERYKCITGDDSLEEDDDGPYLLYADAQATVEALQARVQELEARQHFGACAKCLTNAWRICKEGTPDAVEMKCSNGSTWWLCDYCLSKEQLTRCTAEVEALQRELESANALLHKKNCAIGKAETTIEALQREHAQLKALVRAFIEAWDHDGEPNAVAYEGVVARARATLDATTPAGQRWTRRRPTEPGWYWFRCKYDGKIQAFMIEVRTNDFMWDGQSYERIALGSWFAGEFQGPLTPQRGV